MLHQLPTRTVPRATLFSSDNVSNNACNGSELLHSGRHGIRIIIVIVVNSAHNSVFLFVVGVATAEAVHKLMHQILDFGLERGASGCPLLITMLATCQAATTALFPALAALCPAESEAARVDSRQEEAEQDDNNKNTEDG